MNMYQRKKPTVRQIKLCHILSTQPNISKRQAVLKAGYSVWAAETPNIILRSQSFTSLVDKLQTSLIHNGFTTDFIARKKMEWLDATKLEDGKIVPDFKLQLAAFDRILQLGQENETRKKDKQRVDEKRKSPRSITEFINGESV